MSKRLRLWFLAGLLIVLAAALQVLTYLLAVKHFGRPESAGAFGDLFGATNALFSGLALAGVVIAVVLQTQEIEAQRRAIDDQREEIERTNKQRERERRESSFLTLLKYFRDETHSLRLEMFSREQIGLRAFASTLEYLQKHDLSDLGRSVTQRLDVIREKYRELIPSFSGYIGALRQLIRFASETNKEEREYYLQVLRSQLTTDELSIVAIHSLMPEGANFQTLVEESGLLAHWQAPFWLNVYRNNFREIAFQVIR